MNSIKNQNLKLNLIARLLSAEHLHSSVEAFHNTLHGKYLDFANNEGTLKEEAKAFLLLQDIEKELRLISSYPDFYKKRTIAIAGGFSAGKSEFISSLYDDKSMKLAIGINPTTAIPTYVMNGEKNGVIGSSSRGGIINLLSIDPQFQTKLSHDFINSFGFNLKSIMPFIFLTTKMNYPNLCFIDTPGYNPAGLETTGQDLQTASSFAKSAEALIWIIGLDANGTIGSSDLSFLRDLMEEEEKPLYIVLNKADLRPPNEVENVLDDISERLDEEGIDVIGISAYSSVLRKEITFSEVSLEDFLHSQDESSKKRANLAEQLYVVKRMYKKAIKAEIAHNQKLLGNFIDMERDLYANNIDTNSSMYQAISDMKEHFHSGEHKDNLNKLSDVISEMEGHINKLFDYVEIHHKFEAFDTLFPLPELSFDEEVSDNGEYNSSGAISTTAEITSSKGISTGEKIVWHQIKDMVPKLKNMKYSKNSPFVFLVKSVVTNDSETYVLGDIKCGHANKGIIELITKKGIIKTYITGITRKVYTQKKGIKLILDGDKALDLKSGDVLAKPDSFTSKNAFYKSLEAKSSI